MIKLLDSILNRVTMYRLVLYFLLFLIGAAMVFGWLGFLPYSPFSILFSAGVLLAVCWAANGAFAKAFDAQPNAESYFITALILALIITPVTPTDEKGVAFLIWAGIWAMASKYMFAIGKKHLFNPAAFAVALTAFTIGQSASWWVGGNLPLMVFVVIGGLCGLRKIQRYDLVPAFFIAAFASILFVRGFTDPWGTIEKTILHTPIFFFAFIILTEPLTTPPTKPLRILYGAFVGVLYAPQIHVGPIYSTPELAILVGNIFSYLVSPKKKYFFELRQKHEISPALYDLEFALPEKINFTPGQYMEWTLAHPRGDTRGNRRYFTIASSPTENALHLGVRVPTKASTFKQALLRLEPGDRLLGGQLTGDFTLPEDPKKKLAFIAGGIGITPFRSMVKYLSDNNEKRDAVLFYSNRTTDEIAYVEIFDEAERKIGLRTVYAVTGDGQTPPAKNGVKGRVNADLLTRTLPDYKERTFYISGTHTMTEAFKKTLREMGVPRRQIVVDFFPGFA